MFNDATGNAARNSNNLIKYAYWLADTTHFFGSVLVLHRRPIIHQLLHEIIIEYCYKYWILLQILKYMNNLEIWYNYRYKTNKWENKKVWRRIEPHN